MVLRRRRGRGARLKVRAARSSRPGESSRRCRPRTAGYDPRPDSPEPGGAARRRAYGACARRRMPGPRPGGVHRRTSGRVRMGRALEAQCAMRDTGFSSRPISGALAAGGRCAWGVRSAPVPGAGGSAHEAVHEGLPGAHGACAQAERPLHGNGFPNRPITNASGGARQGADGRVRSEAAARCVAAAPRLDRKGVCRWWSARVRMGRAVGPGAWCGRQCSRGRPRGVAGCAWGVRSGRMPVTRQRIPWSTDQCPLPGRGRVRMRRALGGVCSLRGGCPGPRPTRRVPVAERAGDHGACA